MHHDAINAVFCSCLSHIHMQSRQTSRFTQLRYTRGDVTVCTQEVAVPEVLYEEVIEVDERVVLRQDGCQLPRKDPKRTVTGAKHDYTFLCFVVKRVVKLRVLGEAGNESQTSRL